MKREEFKKKLNELTYSHFIWAKISMKIDGNGNLLQLDETKQKETWDNVDTGRLTVKQMISIIKVAKEGVMII